MLAKLWFGRRKPNWKIIFEKVRETLDQKVSIEFNDVLRTLIFDTKFLVADLPAKAAILNMQQFNAYFGCSICLIESKAIGNGSRGLYYPNQRHKLRTNARRENYIDLKQREGLETSRGVKGPSAVSHITENLPLAAPIDYMHQILLGITRSLLFSIKNHTKKSNLEKINSATETIQLTSDFKRSLRSIDELGYFKANEMKVWLLYIGPVVLRRMICKNLFERFHLLSYATRLLLFSNEHTVLVDQLIKRFHLLTVEAYTDIFFCQFSRFKSSGMAGWLFLSSVVYICIDVLIRKLSLEMQVHRDCEHLKHMSEANCHVPRADRLRSSKSGPSSRIVFKF